MKKINVVFFGGFRTGKSTAFGRIYKEISQQGAEQVLSAIRQLRKIDDFCKVYRSVSDCAQDEIVNNMSIHITRKYAAFEDCEFYLFDTPGHPRYFRSIMNSISLADVAVFFVDVNQDINVTLNSIVEILFVYAKRMSENRVVIVANFMDTCHYSQEVFENFKCILRVEIQKRFGTKNDAIVVPISSQTGENIFEPSYLMPWATTTLFDVIRSFKIPRPRSEEVMLSLNEIGQLKGDGQTAYFVKVIGGTLRKGNVLISGTGQNQHQIIVNKIYKNYQDVDSANAGDFVAVVSPFVEIPKGYLTTKQMQNHKGFQCSCIFTRIKIRIKPSSKVHAYVDGRLINGKIIDVDLSTFRRPACKTVTFVSTDGDITLGRSVVFIVNRQLVGYGSITKPVDNV